MKDTETLKYLFGNLGSALRYKLRVCETGSLSLLHTGIGLFPVTAVTFVLNICHIMFVGTRLIFPMHVRFVMNKIW